MKYVELEKDYVVRSEREFKFKLNRFSKEIAKRLNQNAEDWVEYFQGALDSAKIKNETYFEQYEDGGYWNYNNKYDNAKWTGWDGAKDENGKKYSISWDYYPADKIGSGRLYLYVKQRVEE